GRARDRRLGRKPAAERKADQRDAVGGGGIDEIKRMAGEGIKDVEVLGALGSTKNRARKRKIAAMLGELPQKRGVWADCLKAVQQQGRFTPSPAQHLDTDATDRREQPLSHASHRPCHLLGQLFVPRLATDEDSE